MKKFFYFSPVLFVTLLLASGTTFAQAPESKTAKNTWHVTTSVAEPYLAENRGFISPTGVFMHVDGKLNHPVTLTVNPYREWKQVSTGLDPVKGSTNTMLLDLKIRYESQNMKSLDDVMRTLYQVYNKSKNRGFTDQEFREACELAAGCSLAEVNVKAGNTSRCTLTSLSSPRKRGLHAVR